MNLRTYTTYLSELSLDLHVNEKKLVEKQYFFWRHRRRSITIVVHVVIFLRVSNVVRSLSWVDRRNTKRKTKSEIHMSRYPSIFICASQLRVSNMCVRLAIQNNAFSWDTLHSTVCIFIDKTAYLFQGVTYWFGYLLDWSTSESGFLTRPCLYFLHRRSVINRVQLFFSMNGRIFSMCSHNRYREKKPLRCVKQKACWPKCDWNKVVLVASVCEDSNWKVSSFTTFLYVYGSHPASHHGSENLHKNSILRIWYVWWDIWHSLRTIKIK